MDRLTSTRKSVVNRLVVLSKLLLTDHCQNRREGDLSLVPAASIVLESAALLSKHVAGALLFPMLP